MPMPMPARPLPMSVVVTVTSRSLPSRLTPTRTASPGSRSEIALTISATRSTGSPSTEVMTSSVLSTVWAGSPLATWATRFSCGTLTPVLRIPTAIEFFCEPCMRAAFISSISSSLRSSPNTSSSGTTRESGSSWPCAHSQPEMCRSGPPRMRTVVKYSSPFVG